MFLFTNHVSSVANGITQLILIMQKTAELGPKVLFITPKCEKKKLGYFCCYFSRRLRLATGTSRPFGYRLPMLPMLCVMPFINIPKVSLMFLLALS